LANARGGNKPTVNEALELLEREVRHIEHLIVVSTRPMPAVLTENGGNAGVTPFWRSVQWLNVQARDTDKYFVQAD
jgi:hypothetical protein